MKLKSIVAVLTVATSGGIVWAGTAVGATASGVYADEPKTEADLSRRVCRSVRPTGSRLSERVCRTQRDWDEAAQKVRDGMETQSREETVRNFEGQGPPR